MPQTWDLLDDTPVAPPRSGASWDLLDDPQESWLERSFGSPTRAARTFFKYSPAGAPLWAADIKEDWESLGHGLGSGGRAVDYGVGKVMEAGSEAIQAPGLLRDYASMFEGIPGAAAPEDYERIARQGLELQAGRTDLGTLAAEAIPQPESGALAHVAAAGRGLVKPGVNVIRDPLTYLALGKLVKGATSLKAAAASIFAIQSGQGVAQELGEAKRLYDEAGGWTPQATQAVASAVALGYATKQGAKHALGETARAVREGLAPADAGSIYVHDPSALPAAREARAAELSEADVARAAQIEDAGASLVREVQRPGFADTSKDAPPAAGEAAMAPSREGAFQAPPESAGSPAEAFRPPIEQPFASPVVGTRAAVPRVPLPDTGFQAEVQPGQVGSLRNRGAELAGDAPAPFNEKAAANDVRTANRARLQAVVPGKYVPQEPAGGSRASAALEAGQQKVLESLADAGAIERGPDGTPKPSAAQAEHIRARLLEVAHRRSLGESKMSGLTKGEIDALKSHLANGWENDRTPAAAPGNRGIEAMTPARPAPKSFGEKVDRAIEGAKNLWRNSGPAFVRTLDTALAATERMPGVGKEIAGRLKAMVQDWETGLGSVEARSTRALQQVVKRFAPLRPKDLEGSADAKVIAEWLDAQKTELAPLELLPDHLRPQAEALRQVKLADRQALIDTGRLTPDAPLGLWPHLPTAEVAPRFELMNKALDLSRRAGIPLEEAVAELNKNKGQLVGGTRSGRRAGAEYERGDSKAALQPGEYRTDWGAWFESLRETQRRIAEARHLGADGEVVQGLVEKLSLTDRGGKMSNKAFVQKLVDRVRDVEQQGFGHTLSSAIRSFQAGVGLVKSPFTQLATVQNTMAEAGVIPTVKAISDTFLKQPTGPDGKPMRWTQPVKRVRAAMNEARLNAAEQGALYASQAEGIVDYALKARQVGNAPVEGAPAKIAARLWHIRGTGWTDALQRTWAAGTAKYAVPKLWEEAKAGSKTAQRELDRWHVDWRRDAVTPEAINTAAKRIADLSQFKVSTGEVPLWASSPWGKVAFQFQSFGYAHARFMGHIVDEGLTHGNWAPLAKAMVVGAAAGYATNELKRAIFSGQAPENPSEEDFKTALQNAFSGRRHYDPQGENGAILAAAEGLGAAGGLGVLGSLYERAAGGSSAKMLFGASGADVDAAQRLLTAATTGKPLKGPALSLAAGLAPVGPLGLNPREALRELASKDPIPNPGYTGQAMDALGLGPGPEARAAQGELTQNAAASKRAEDALSKLVTPQVAKPIDKRLEESRKRRLADELRLELADAIRTGNKARERDVYRRAFRAGLTGFGRNDFRERVRPAEVSP